MSIQSLRAPLVSVDGHLTLNPKKPADLHLIRLFSQSTKISNNVHSSLVFSFMGGRYVEPW